jgi:hypothetical protein
MTEALLQYSSELSNSRIIPETRVRYANKQLKIVKWFIDNYPNLVDQTVDPPNLRLEAISPVVVGALLASFVINGKTDKDGGSKPYSMSHLNQYRSAFKSLYKDAEVAVPADVDIEISNCMSGYQNKVAKFKNDGVLPSREGVDAFSSYTYR